ncbi:MAG TPA: tetratricopeptide repeat protein [Pyrinomonadaceae bacterium]
MKRCPSCNRIETDDALAFCRVDGTRLVADTADADAPTRTFRSSEYQRTEVLHGTGASAPQKYAVGSSSTGRVGQARTSPEYGRKRAFIITVVVSAVIVVAVAGFVAYRRASISATPIDSIAVLPFQNQSSEADTEYLSDGLAESLIYRLSQLPNLKVSPTSSVLHYKGKGIDPVKVGNELGVSAVMTGRIAQRGENLTISVELIDVRTAKLIWGEQYDRKVSDLLATQREIASEITQRLKLKLSREEQGLTKHYTENNEAYQFYLKGRFYWNKRTETDLKKGIEYFRQAVEADPKFALAWAGLADSYSLLPVYSETPTNEVRGRIRQAATTALELDPNLAEAHTSYARLLFDYEWNFAEAEKEFRKAIELNPNYATAHHWFSLLLSVRQRREEAFKEITRALEIEPLSRILNNDYGQKLFNDGQTDQAIDQFKKTLELYPDFATAHSNLALALAKAGKYQEAVNEQNQAIALAGRKSLLIAQMGYIYGVMGNRREAEKLLEELLERKERVGNYYVSIIYAGLGDKNKVFEYLEKAYQQRELLVPYITIYSYFDFLRGDPRYQDLITSIGLTS